SALVTRKAILSTCPCSRGPPTPNRTSSAPKALASASASAWRSRRSSSEQNHPSARFATRVTRSTCSTNSDDSSARAQQGSTDGATENAAQEARLGACRLHLPRAGFGPRPRFRHLATDHRILAIVPLLRSVLQSEVARPRELQVSPVPGGLLDQHQEHGDL